MATTTLLIIALGGCGLALLLLSPRLMDDAAGDTDKTDRAQPWRMTRAERAAAVRSGMAAAGVLLILTGLVLTLVHLEVMAWFSRR